MTQQTDAEALLREVRDALRLRHSPFLHDHERDEVACNTCGLLRRVDAALSRPQAPQGAPRSMADDPFTASELLASLRLDPHAFHTEGGVMNLPKLRAALLHPSVVVLIRPKLSPFWKAVRGRTWTRKKRCVASPSTPTASLKSRRTRRDRRGAGEGGS